MWQDSFEIAGRRVGKGAPTFIIAEAGSNHNGDIDKALELIDVAAEAGADAVKFQTFKAKRLYNKGAGTSDYLGDPTPIYDIIAAMEMPDEWLPTLHARAKERGLAFISSPFHEEAVEVLAPYVDCFKIASYEMNHHPLLRAVARKNKPVIMSTGASKLAEVGESLRVLLEEGCTRAVILQCTAAYPAPMDSINVRALVTLSETYDIPAGLSDHSFDPITAPMTAAALGAAVIEKHYTLSQSLPGPDHAFAIEPDGLAALVRRVREVEQVLGAGVKDVHGVEDELRHFARRSIYTTQAVAAGEIFSRENVDVLRHGKLETGLPPEAWERVLGAVAQRDLAAEAPVQTADVGPKADA